VSIVHGLAWPDTFYGRGWIEPRLPTAATRIPL
jgi:hypothetical protein